MKMVEEASMRTYPNLGVHEAFHPTSHWGGFPERIANLRKIQNYHTARVREVRAAPRRTRRTATARCSTIRSSCSAATWRNSDAHNNDPLPQALIGRGGGVKGNQHLHYPQDTPHANILVTMLDRAGVPAEEHREVRATAPGRSRKSEMRGLIDARPSRANGGGSVRRPRSCCWRLPSSAGVGGAEDADVNRRNAGRQHAAAVGRLRRRRRRGSRVCSRRRRRVARQQLRRHADEPGRRSRQHRRC